jgi:uncharacterized protein
LAALDLSDIPVIDEHCHGFYKAQHGADVGQWRRHFTESGDEGARGEQVTSSLFYSRLLRELAEFFGCPPEEGAILEAHNRLDVPALIGSLLRDANIEMLLIDQGFPAAGLVLPDTEVGSFAPCRVAPLLRLEVLMQQLISRYDALDEVTEALRGRLSDIRVSGYVGLKSIVAYRSGLDIGWWERSEVEASFAEARHTASEGKELRLSQKPLLDFLLHIAFTEAARQEVPVQFHTGYGDTDVDLVMANPLYLRRVLEHRPYRGMPIVLLHECYPYTRQGGYLAAVYENVYLDLSYATPFLSLAEMISFTRQALGVAPIAKLLYSSDAVGVPELHWIGATDGRRVLGHVLAEAVATGDLSEDAAREAGKSILHDTALRLYNL